MSTKNTVQNHSCYDTIFFCASPHYRNFRNSAKVTTNVQSVFVGGDYPEQHSSCPDRRNTGLSSRPSSMFQSSSHAQSRLCGHVLSPEINGREHGPGTDKARSEHVLGKHFQRTFFLRTHPSHATFSTVETSEIMPRWPRMFKVSMLEGNTETTLPLPKQK